MRYDRFFHSILLFIPFPYHSLTHTLACVGHILQWGFVIGFAFAPFTVDEITKCFYRLTGFGIRPAAQLTGVALREHKARLDVTTQMPADAKANH